VAIANAKPATHVIFELFSTTVMTSPLDPTFTSVTHFPVAREMPLRRRVPLRSISLDVNGQLLALKIQNFR
jgi:hypothetical protein